MRRQWCGCNLGGARKYESEDVQIEVGSGEISSLPVT